MARKKDIGHEETEAVLSELEGRIYKEYAQAETELSEKLEDYMSRFEKKDALKQQALANGQITQKEYDDWYTGQVAMGKRWESMRDTISEDLTTAAQKAQSITYGYMPEVYAINHNYGTYQVESLFNIDTKYTAYNAQTVERLFDDNDKLYHDYGITVGQHINEGKMQEWNKRQVQSVMTQSILQGESIGAIATRMQKELGDSVLLEDIKDQNKKTAEEIADELVRRNRNAAIRNARTITTGVENAARIDSYKRAEDMGIKLEQEWLATLDGRTRHEHRILDGQRVKVGEKFKVAGYEIAFPADPTAEAFLVYNCRCTLVPALEGHGKSASDVSSRHTDNMEEETYEEWKESHNIHSDSITKQDDIAETMKRKYGKMYSSYAGGGGSGGGGGKSSGGGKKASETITPTSTTQTTNTSTATSTLTKEQLNNYEWLQATAEINQIDYKPVEKLTKTLTDNEIISKLSGGDETKGSCASVALAYCANYKGLDVTDYKGGTSQAHFSRKVVVERMMSIANADVQTYNVKKQASETAKIITNSDNIKTGKLYYLSCGKHAAVIRCTEENGLEYLELQNETQSGWTSFEKYGSVEKTLNKRFGCTKKAVTVGGMASETTVRIYDVDSMEITSEFTEMMGYINTDTKKQKKGKSGSVK